MPLQPNSYLRSAIALPVSAPLCLCSSFRCHASPFLRISKLCFAFPLPLMSSIRSAFACRLCALLCLCWSRLRASLPSPYSFIHFYSCAAAVSFVALPLLCSALLCSTSALLRKTIRCVANPWRFRALLFLSHASQRIALSMQLCSIRRISLAARIYSPQRLRIT